MSIGGLSRNDLDLLKEYLQHVPTGPPVVAILDEFHRQKSQRFPELAMHLICEQKERAQLQLYVDSVALRHLLDDCRILLAKNVQTRYEGFYSTSTIFKDESGQEQLDWRSFRKELVGHMETKPRKAQGSQSTHSEHSRFWQDRVLECLKLLANKRNPNPADLSQIVNSFYRTYKVNVRTIADDNADMWTKARALYAFFEQKLNAPQEHVRDTFDINIRRLGRSMQAYKEMFDDAFEEPVTASILFGEGVAEFIADTGGLRVKLNNNVHGNQLSIQEVRGAVGRARRTFDLSPEQDAALKALFTAWSKHKSGERARDPLP